ncbi:hypothetical protein BEL04_09945 [Mucilaginibacter sp. PPCGB 2223]|uniref:hypothetical protein n=1 Tax=Mucilaginibacter sp. PPCGB 2223 TaxID=1886027 RepID=UPI0008258E99|nr:hypothetical protein [Mucilaginibacter sp. PPCGB 2223]OCX54548.1 hypothetical protein BEL04_09945 [Mucilaginibacter sp. PPCGB 2223]
MKIIFICNSLAEGKDGVGDQTTRLAIECAGRGMECILVGFSDRNTTEQQFTSIQHDIPVYRFPASWPFAKREAELKTVMDAHQNIDWVSIQFVSYALNKHGIVREAIPIFKQLFKGFKIHVMFHELWVAEERQASLKMKLLGRVQKFFIRLFLKQLKPLIIHTSIPLYKKMLERAGFKAEILPLFSNIARADSRIEDMEDRVPVHMRENRGDYIVGCIFGSIYHDSWDMDSLLSRLENVAGKKVLISSIGKIGYGKEFWEGLPAKYPRLEFLTFGMQDENFISYWLTHFVDLGIVTTPAIITGKSSSMMAYIDHGIPVYCDQNKLSFDFEVTEDLIDKRLIQVVDDFEFKLVPRVPPKSLIKETTEIFVKALNEFK